MAALVFRQYYANRTSDLRRRVKPQGRKPSGLAKPQLVRLYNDDKHELERRAAMMGEYWNENEFIRQAVHKAIEETKSIYTEFAKT